MLLLHGMLFTNIQLKNFTGMLTHFLKRLKMECDNIKEREWIMMGIINLGAMLEYGRASGIICNLPSPSIRLAAARLLDRHQLSGMVQTGPLHISTEVRYEN